MIQSEPGTPKDHKAWRTRVARPPWAEFAILVAALVIRLWRLSYHSIWFDESVSLKWARSDPSYIWQITFPLAQDKHPPLYYLLLHYWQQILDVFGLASNDAALRVIGSVLGVLTVAGVLLLAGRLASRTTGLLAGMLVASAPLLVWYSQELRMFQPAATAIVWSSCSLLFAWRRPKDRRRYLWWLLFISTTLAALYSYLFSAFILPAAAMTVLFLSIQRRSTRFFIEGTVALAVVTLLFLPLANNAWLVNANESTPGTAFGGFAENTFRMLRVFTVWRAPWPATVVTTAAVIYGLLGLIGLVLPYPKEKQFERVGKLDIDQLWIATWLLTPFLIANIMLSRSGSIFDEDRYLLFLAPFFLWAVARGVSTLASRSRALGWATGAVAVTPLLIALPVLWTPFMARENWRAAADYIIEYSGASAALPDAVIAHVDYTHEPLEWYLRQSATFDELPVFFPFGGTLTPEQIEDVIAPPLLGLVDFGTHTAWLTQSHLEGVDDQRLVEKWFADNYPVVTEQFPAGIKLSAYALQYRYPVLPTLSDRAVYPDTEMASGIVLAACEVIEESVSAQNETMHPPSGWVHARLWWRAEEPIENEYVTTAKIVGAEGEWGDRLYRDGDLMNKWPTSSWLPGEYVREDIDINLNPLTPSGVYPVLVGLTDPEGIEVSPAVQCGTVDVR